MWWEKILERLSVKSVVTVWLIWLYSDLVRAGIEVPATLNYLVWGVVVTLFGLRELGKMVTNGKGE